MQEKLIRHDGDIFESYELLEMLLFFRLPYKNTNPIAKQLLHRFGSLKGIFEAESEELVKVSGVGERCAGFLKRLGELFSVESSDDGVCDRDDYANENRIAMMLHSHFSDNKDATFAIVAFDNSHRIISTEVRCDVDFNSGSMNASYYTDFAIRNSASMIVTASNRRYGSPLPKPSDRESAMMASRALNSIDVHYAEHFVFAGNSYARVLPTLTTPLLNRAPLFSEIVNEIDNKIAENENKHCHNGDVFRLFDEIASSFCKEHFERTSVLFERFKALSSILMTDYRTLSSIVGERLAVFVRVIANIAKRRITDLVRLEDIADERELGEYLSALCIPLNREVLFLISYGADGRVISIDSAGEGTLNSSSVTPRALVEIAMRHSAKRVSIAHNHPYGAPELSNADLTFTKTIYDTFLALGIELSKHFCISGRGVIALSAPFDNL